MIKKLSPSLKTYIKYLKEQAEKFKLTEKDLSNLYDLLEIVDTPSDMCIDFRETIKLNKMDTWFYGFKSKIEDIVIYELNDKDTKKVKGKKKNGS